PAGALVLDSPFRRVIIDPRATWIADATLRTPRGRRIAAVQVEIGPWSAARDTELLVRPVARAPHLWSGAHVRRYFDAAHAAADSLTDLLVHGVPPADDRQLTLDRRSAISGRYSAGATSKFG